MLNCFDKSLKILNISKISKDLFSVFSSKESLLIMNICKETSSYMTPNKKGLKCRENTSIEDEWRQNVLLFGKNGKKLISSNLLRFKKRQKIEEKVDSLSKIV